MEIETVQYHVFIKDFDFNFFNTLSELGYVIVITPGVLNKIAGVILTICVQKTNDENMVIKTIQTLSLGSMMKINEETDFECISSKEDFLIRAWELKQQYEKFKK